MACALCSVDFDLIELPIAPHDESLALCATCHAAATGEISDAPHWQCLHEAIWSTDAATQVLAYRLLKALPEAPWARDLLEIAYLDPATLEWAEAATPSASDIVHRDSNGAVLGAGDNVVLIKDLPVKGAGFTAKRGTPVRNISLVQDNDGQIEGRVEGQRIVILTKFVKKTG
ncbi:alkylphosphonate utilization protein [Cognatishimia maritima]|uniref:Phosphonoacetate hydrolase n=1 Tax=Cognatishimia maritima TaxID=870908 RepID=A0A1M5JXJ3_9RHOB|nr:alkylphosphonate utilization protein [Cognatishimia maritima]SHG45238.1 phosphonoacetate hydrolase [Cognatishimia maritima]